MAKSMPMGRLTKLLNTEIAWSAGHRYAWDRDMVTGIAWSLGPDAGTLWVQQDNGPMALVHLTDDGATREVRLAGASLSVIEERLRMGAAVAGKVVHIVHCAHRYSSRYAWHYVGPEWAMVAIAKEGCIPCAHCLTD